VCIVLCCGLMVFVLARFKLVVCALVCVVGSTGFWWGAQWLFNRYGLFLSPVPSLITFGSSFMLLGVIRFRGEEKEAIQRSQELSLVQQCAIISLVTLVETRDSETGFHIVRTQKYLRALAEQLSKRPEYKKILTPEAIDTAYISAPLHDIGKVGVPDHILLKPGALTEDEYAVMRQHTIIGQRALQHAVSLSGLDVQSSFLHCAEEIAAAHHERWDGKGYPYGLSGRDIPLIARLMTLADVYDAMCARRCYQEPLTHSAAVENIRAGSGTLFDPDAVQAFLEIEADFLRISEQYLDQEQ
jgi:putative two-component system response regulator